MSQHMVYDVAVIGGGPAGAMIAARLREYGFTVALLEGVTRAGWSCGYSIPATAAHWLREVGKEADFLQSGALRLQGSRIRWSQDETETRDGASFIIDPVTFAAALRAKAFKQGVTLLQLVKVQRLEQMLESWQIHCAAGRQFNARFVVDATGRRSKFAGTRTPYLPRTAALTASFRDVPLPATHQCTEALRDGWLWGAPLPDGRFAVAMFTDPAQLQGLTATQQTARLQEWLLASELLRPCLRGTLTTVPMICDATGEQAVKVATAHCLRIGDAALSLDPLSSQGILAAMRSAWQGASVVRTILQHPENTAAAIAFHELHISKAAALNRNTSGEIYASVKRFAHESFWAARVVPSAKTETLRQPMAMAARLRLNAQVELRSTPVLQNGWIEEATALYAPAFTLPVAYLGNIALAPLVRLIEPGCTGTELLQRWVKRLPLSQCQSLLQWLWQAGILEPV